MSTIVVQAFITLDGVVQAGGGPDEDREGGFEHGGWAMDYDDRMDSSARAGTSSGRETDRGSAAPPQPYAIFALPGRLG